MDFFLTLTCQLIEEERNAGNKHHYTMENCVEEQHPYFSFERLHCTVLNTLDITADRIVTVENERLQRTGDSTADHSEYTDNKR